jgi:hypothetical protein
MFDLLQLIEFAPSRDASTPTLLLERLVAAARALDPSAATMLEPTLPGTRNGGDVIWRIRFPDERRCNEVLASDAWQGTVEPLLADRDRIAAVECVRFPVERAGGASPGRGVFRVALFCANQRPSSARTASFEDDLASMAHYIGTIRSWQLSCVTTASGSRPWTHVWEQEYDTLDGLTGAYMSHPSHWSHVERWFDPEYPEWLVDPWLCHSFCAVTQPVLRPSSPSA